MSHFSVCYGLWNSVLFYHVLFCQLKAPISDLALTSLVAPNESGYFHLVVSSYCYQNQVIYFLLFLWPSRGIWCDDTTVGWVSSCQAWLLVSVLGRLFPRSVRETAWIWWFSVLSCFSVVRIHSPLLVFAAKPLQRILTQFLNNNDSHFKKYFFPINIILQIMP